MIKFTIIIVTILMVVNCAQKTKADESQDWYELGKSVIDYSRNATYYHDTKTNLCFVILGFHSAAGVACVPCESLSVFKKGKIRP